jgi:hypothetical protein
MIFGFNTDVKAGDTVYHVQSEARENDLLLQTQVFVKGRILGKRASSYAEDKMQPDFSQDRMHELLKIQHKLMVDAVREKRVEPLFCTDGEVQDVNPTGLAVKWLNPEAVFPAGTAVLKLAVADDHKAADGALLTSRLEVSHDAPIHSQSMTEVDGTAELEITLPTESTHETVVVGRATQGDKSLTRKFRLRRS